MGGSWGASTDLAGGQRSAAHQRGGGRARGGLDGLEIGLEVELGVWVTTVVVMVGVGVGVLVKQSPVTVTGIQLMFLASRVCSTVTVPWAAEQEA